MSARSLPRRPLTQRENAELVNDWNSRFGTAVRVQVTLDDGSTKETKTRSEAWLLGGHTAVVMLEGISGAYALTRVSAL